jgi:integrase
VFRNINRHGHLEDRLSTNAVAGIVQHRAARVRLDETSFSGHSMRAGFATSAAMNGIEKRLIMRQTRHRSTTVVRRYIRDGELFRRNLTAEVGL